MINMAMRSLATGLLLIGAFAANAADHAPHWAYGGEHGPGKWGEMEADFATCKLGHEQSPIDIRNAEKSALPALDFEYTKSTGEIVNNGHSIQINLDDGGVLKLDGVPYKLVQFHFHAPSEEKINGKGYSMVAHLVHQSADGKLAVIAVLLTEGKANAALDLVFKRFPQTVGSEKALDGDFNANDLLPATRNYYKYVGSLTTPPCSEGVRWQVLKQPVELSKGQIAAFRKLYSMNARPIQPVNGRKIEEN